MIKLLKYSSLCFFIMLLIVSACGWVYIHKKPNITKPTIVFIPKGMSRVEIATMLEEQHLITLPQAFLALNLALGKKPILAGEYELLPSMNTLAILQHLQSGEVIHRSVTIPEGYTVYQVTKLLEATEGLVGNVPDTIAEGSLFPETYFFNYGDNRADIVARMQLKHNDVMDELCKINNCNIKILKDMNGVLTLASIVERETGVGGERAKIAGVFYNRLKKNMMLQTDPTVIYAVSDGKGILPRALMRKDLMVNSPYNTYRVVGLPPTPICNPSKASIEAVLHPEETNALYFVASGEGGHLFANTLHDHNRNVARYKATLQKH